MDKDTKRKLTSAKHVILDFSETKYKLISKVDVNKKRIDYSYMSPHPRRWQTSTLYLMKSKFSQEDLDFIDELFNNLDKDNLAIIKGIIASRNG